jgi:hypothetical protein
MTVAGNMTLIILSDFLHRFFEAKPVVGIISHVLFDF